jgi:hypothetical protein
MGASGGEIERDGRRLGVVEGDCRNVAMSQIVVGGFAAQPPEGTGCISASGLTSPQRARGARLRVILSGSLVVL